MTGNGLWPLAPSEAMLDPDTISKNVEEKNLALADLDRKAAEVRNLRARLAAAKRAQENQAIAETILADVVPVVNRNGVAVGYMTGRDFTLATRPPSTETNFGYLAMDMDADIVGRLAGLVHGHGWVVARLWNLPVGTTARTVAGGITMPSGLGEQVERGADYLKVYRHTVIIGTPQFVASAADHFLADQCDGRPRSSTAMSRLGWRYAASVMLATLVAVLIPGMISSFPSFALATGILLVLNYLMRSWPMFPLVAHLPVWLARRWRPSLDRYRNGLVANRFIDRLADRIGTRTAMWYWRTVAPIDMSDTEEHA